LRVLHLRNNMIDNMEALIQADIKDLRIISLGSVYIKLDNNPIMDISGLKWCNWKEIRTIDLSIDYI